MKIIIIGAGIGGLSSYLAIDKFLKDILPPQTLSVRVYESHANPLLTTTSVGGGLGLSPNGLRAIALLAPDAARHIVERDGFPNERMTMRNSKGALLGRVSAGSRKRYGYPQVMVARQRVHERVLE